MPINPKDDSNSTIFSSHSATTSSYPPHGPAPKNWQQKVMAALRIVFGWIRVVAAGLKGRWNSLVTSSGLKGRWNSLVTNSFKRKQSIDDLTDPMLPRIPSTRKLHTDGLTDSTLPRVPSTRKQQIEPKSPFTTQSFDYLPDLSYQQDQDDL